MWRRRQCVALGIKSRRSFNPEALRQARHLAGKDLCWQGPDTDLSAKLEFVAVGSRIGYASSPPTMLGNLAGAGKLKRVLRGLKHLQRQVTLC
jgi:hypothetical protein